MDEPFPEHQYAEAERHTSSLLVVEKHAEAQPSLHGLSILPKELRRVLRNCV
jgi:hypothetical protein